MNIIKHNRQILKQLKDAYKERDVETSIRIFTLSFKCQTFLTCNRTNERKKNFQISSRFIRSTATNRLISLRALSEHFQNILCELLCIVMMDVSINDVDGQ